MVSDDSRRLPWAVKGLRNPMDAWLIFEIRAPGWSWPYPCWRIPTWTATDRSDVWLSPKLVSPSLTASARLPYLRPEIKGPA